MTEKRIVRRRGGFADRNGMNPISKQIQYTEFDADTRTVLKNNVIEIIDSHKRSMKLSNFDFQLYFAKRLSKELFCLPLDSENSYYDNVLMLLYSVFDIGKYYDILDVIEYFAVEIKVRDFEKEAKDVLLYNERKTYFVDLKSRFNLLFENECIGYRFVQDHILKITSQEEIDSIEKSTETVYEKVNGHMLDALRKLSSKTERDYKGAISESCQALECLLNSLLGKEGFTLGEAIKKYWGENKYLHPALRESLLKFYGYASDSAGIRHDTNKRDYFEGYDEAKMILVCASAFINYLISTNENRKLE